MIRAEELMIDDWVLAYGKKTQVVWTSNIIKLAVRGFPNELFEDEILPIHITPEILEKNGFEQEDNDYYVWNGNLERIIWLDDGYTVITSVRCDRVYKGQCYNVHELQHALKICGISKNIEL